MNYNIILLDTMAWKTITFQEQSIQYYSLADSIETLHDYFMAFWSGLTPGYFALLFVCLISLILVGVLVSVNRAIKSGYLTG